MSTKPNVLLRGDSGRGVRHADRVCHVPADIDSVKLDRGSHYEHFHRTDEWEWQDGRELQVFDWSHLTHVAE